MSATVVELEQKTFSFIPEEPESVLRGIDLGERIALAAAAKGAGWNLTNRGLLKADPTVPGLPFVPMASAEAIRMFLGVPRGWIWPDYGDRPLVTPQELGAWVERQRWVESRCAGQLHSFVTRNSVEDDLFFARIVRTTYKLGYDGIYLHKTWRYLDLGPDMFFACGSRIEECSLLNRKLRPEGQAPKPWVRNKTPIKLPSMKES